MNDQLVLRRHCGPFWIARVARALTAAMLFTLATMTSATVLGQGFSSIEPPTSKADLKILISKLDLTPNQEAAARSLHEGFVQILDEKTEPFRELEQRYRRARAMRSPDLDELTKEYEPALSDFFLMRSNLGDAFTKDFKALLTPHQLNDLWPAAEMAAHRRRLRGMGGYGVTGWSRFDLEAALGGQKLSASEDAVIAPIMAAWEAEIDRLILERERANEHHLRLSFEQQKRSEDEAAKTEISFAKRATDINRRFSQRVASALPPEARFGFEAVLNRAVYPLFSEPRGGRMLLESTSKLTDLTADQRLALTAASEAYERASLALDKAVVARSDSAEAEVDRFNVQPSEQRNMAARQGKDPMTVIYSEISGAREQLEAKTAEAVRRLLSADQVRAAEAGAR